MKLTFTKQHHDFEKGKTYDVDPAYGMRLITSGVAVEAGAKKQQAAPQEPEVETAVERPRTKRKRPADD